MESDKYICVRETAPQNSVVIIDMSMPSQPLRRPITADSALMNPNSRILALKAQVPGTTQDHLQIFNIEAKAKLKSYQMPEQAIFWKWITPKLLGLVTQTSVNHWSIDGDSEPVKMFERAANLANNQIINYRCDPSEKWLVLIGIAPGSAEIRTSACGYFALISMEMQLDSKKGWKSIVPLNFGGKSATRFCFLPKAKSFSLSPGQAPVYLNVYDLTPMNGYLYWAGLGIFHSGVEVHGVEYAYGAHDFPTSGVFEVDPHQCPGFKFRKSICIGTTNLDPKQVREFMERHASNYSGDSYHLIVKNCNHFCKDVCHKLTGKKIPKWVNRLAKIGSTCNCILPETLKVTTVEKDGNVVMHEGEKRCLRNSFGCLSSISMRQRQLSMSSLFLRSPLKSCLSSCEPKQSKKQELLKR